MGTQRRAGLSLAALGMAVAVMVAGCGGGGRHAGATRSTTPATAGTTTTTTFTLEPPSPGSGPPPTTVPSNPKSAPPTTQATTTTTTRPPTVSEQAALARLVASYAPRTSVTSGILHTGSITYVAVAHDLPLSSVIDIFVLQGSGFVNVAANIGADQSLGAVDPTIIRTGNITGARFPDFLVPLAAGNHDNGVLVSNVGGTWHLIGVSERTGAAASKELVEPNIVGTEITQSVNDCAPSCAQGTYSVTTYAYNGGIGKLMSIGPTVQSPTA